MPELPPLLDDDDPFLPPLAPTMYGHYPSRPRAPWSRKKKRIVSLLIVMAACVLIVLASIVVITVLVFGSFDQPIHQLPGTFDVDLKQGTTYLIYLRDDVTDPTVSPGEVSIEAPFGFPMQPAGGSSEVTEREDGSRYKAQYSIVAPISGTYTVTIGEYQTAAFVAPVVEAHGVSPYVVLLGQLAVPVFVICLVVLIVTLIKE